MGRLTEQLKKADQLHKNRLYAVLPEVPTPVEPGKVGIGEIAKELPKGIVETFQLPAFMKFGASLGQAVGERGFEPGKTYPGSPGLVKPYQTYQTEAGKLAEEVVAGEKPLAAPLLPMGEATLTGLSILGLAKTFFPDIYLTGAPEIVKNVPKWVVPGGKLVIERGGKVGEVVPSPLVEMVSNFAKEISAPKVKVEKPAKVKQIAREVYEPVSKKQKISAMEEPFKEGGVTQEKFYKKWGYRPTEDEIANAQTAISDAGIGTKDNAVEKIDKINKSITTISQKEVTPALKNVPGDRFIQIKKTAGSSIMPDESAQTMRLIEDLRQTQGQTAVDDYLAKYWNVKENRNLFSTDVLKERINILQPTGTTKYNVDNTKQFEGMKETAIKVIDEMKPSDPFSGWQTRKAIDGVLKDQFGDALYDTDNLYHQTAKQANKMIRDTFNSYIGETAGKEGKAVFDNALKRLTSLYDVRENLVMRNWKLFNSALFLRYLKSNPAAEKVINLAGGAGAITALMKIIK